MNGESEQRPVATGHREGQLGISDDDPGITKHLKQLDRRGYWLMVLTLAVLGTVALLGYQNFWLPQKPIVWKPWSRFLVQQAASLQHPILVHVLDGTTSDEKTDQELEAVLEKMQTAEFRKPFHKKAGEAFQLEPGVAEDQILWLFEARPEPSSLWYCPPGGKPEQIDVADFQWDQWMKDWGQTTAAIPNKKP